MIWKNFYYHRSIWKELIIILYLNICILKCLEHYFGFSPIDFNLILTLIFMAEGLIIMGKHHGERDSLLPFLPTPAKIK